MNFSIVVPVKDEVDLIPRTLPSYYAVNPSEVIVCTDKPAPKEVRQVIEKVAAACDAQDITRIVEVERDGEQVANIWRKVHDKPIYIVKPVEAEIIKLSLNFSVKNNQTRPPSKRRRNQKHSQSRSKSESQANLHLNRLRLRRKRETTQKKTKQTP